MLRQRTFLRRRLNLQWEAIGQLGSRLIYESCIIRFYAVYMGELYLVFEAEDIQILARYIIIGLLNCASASSMIIDQVTLHFQKRSSESVPRQTSP